MLTFKPQQEEKSELAKTAAFLNWVMKKKHFSAEYLNWQYLENPLGKAIAIGAFADEEMVGHYAAQPILSLVNGVETRGLFILNAAVAPASQGQGLLRGIADRLHGQADAQGFRFMIGVGNRNSTPIYTKKFGFRSFGAITAKVGLGIPQAKHRQSNYYERIWSADSLTWRLANPCCRYRVCRIGNRTVIYKFNYPFLSTIMADFPGQPLGEYEISRIPLGLKLFLGVDPNISWEQSRTFVDFPEMAKPSPLVLIFRELGQAEIPITRNNLLFRGIDFDAF